MSHEQGRIMSRTGSNQQGRVEQGRIMSRTGSKQGRIMSRTENRAIRTGSNHGTGSNHESNRVES